MKKPEPKQLVAWVVASAVVITLTVVWYRDWSAERAIEHEVAQHVARAQEIADSGDRLSDARVELDRALKKSPNDVPALLLRARVLLGLAFATEAQSDLIVALRHVEGEERARTQLLFGDVLAERYRGSGSDEHFRAARNAYLEAQQANVTKASGLFGFGMLFLEKGSNRDLDKGFEVLQQLVDRFPDTPEAKSAQAFLTKIRRPPQSGG
ncbi:MAG: hypothetical protein EXS13_07535 [Planctomycetes bacterium]|nr:hypothetical protein [Planctomycetota bacterium]